MADGRPEVAAERGGRRATGAAGGTSLLARRPLAVLGVALWLGLVHALAAYGVWQSGWLGQAAWKLGLDSRSAEFDGPYRGRRAQLRRLAGAIEPGGVLFLGDSLLASLDIGALADRAVQLSIPGDTLRRVEERLGDYPVGDARLVVLHAGTNDLAFREPAELRESVTRLLGAVPAAVPVVVSAALPVGARFGGGYGNDEVRAANGVLAQACAARPGCTLVDGGPAVADAAGDLDPRYHVGDGIHLNGTGLRAWAAALAPALAPWRDAR